MLVQDFLHRSAARQPDKVALICEGQRLTYAEIEAKANRLANAMLEHGVKRGDRVALYLPNSAEAVVGIFAILKAGGVFVVVNSTTKRDKLAYILNNCQATALLIEAGKTALSQQLMADVPSLKFSVSCGQPTARTAGATPEPGLNFNAVQAAYPTGRPPQTNIDLDLACLIYTSGSTGDSKGVMSDHSNMVFAANSIVEYLQNTADDIVINVLPLSFDYGLYQLLMVFNFGGTLVLERSFAYPAAIFQRIAAERVTGFPGVPTIFAIVLQMDLAPYDLSSLRYLTNTAAALPPSHIMALRQKFPHATIYSMYGLTETKRTLYLPPAQLERRPGSVGIAIPGTEVWLEDEQGQRLGPGEIGELVVRGRHVMRGYWADPAATAARYRPGPVPGERVCYTGDLFRMDEEGYMYFVGRKDDIIKSRGEKVAPKEVENVLYALPGVVEAAVVGVPDPLQGEAIKAFVVVNGPQVTTADVLAHCRAHLEDFMLPKYVEFREQLPKTTSGKIKKTELT
ncbi:MAG: AMP-binding protein [Anaerolineae bacterium]|nr:AMP-binding protein [Anaerolineae bacterium]